MDRNKFFLVLTMACVFIFTCLLDIGKVESSALPRILLTFKQSTIRPGWVSVTLNWLPNYSPGYKTLFFEKLSFKRQIIRISNHARIYTYKTFIDFPDLEYLQLHNGDGVYKVILRVKLKGTDLSSMCSIVIEEQQWKEALESPGTEFVVKGRMVIQGEYKDIPVKLVYNQFEEVLQVKPQVDLQ